MAACFNSSRVPVASPYCSPRQPLAHPSGNLSLQSAIASYSSHWHPPGCTIRLWRPFHLIALLLVLANPILQKLILLFHCHDSSIHATSFIFPRKHPLLCFYNQLEFLSPLTGHTNTHISALPSCPYFIAFKSSALYVSNGLCMPFSFFQLRHPLAFLLLLLDSSPFINLNSDPAALWQLLYLPSGLIGFKGLQQHPLLSSSWQLLNTHRAALLLVSARMGLSLGSRFSY
ncbi:hypothetical protein L7F22_033142 [Adiantum nelumboides]|nr:hypothetical protein [Adiantum nelumboides]